MHHWRLNDIYDDSAGSGGSVFSGIAKSADTGDEETKGGDEKSDEVKGSRKPVASKKAESAVSVDEKAKAGDVNPEKVKPMVSLFWLPDP
jgi:hypothetical protein